MKRNSRCRSLRIEALETRCLLTVTAQFAGGMLAVTGDDNANSIEVSSAVGPSGTHYILVLNWGAVVLNGPAENARTADVTNIRTVRRITSSFTLVAESGCS